MKAVIAEKPSVAREIAALLGATNKMDGFFSGGGYCVTWALGHLVGLAMPEDYDIAGFRAAALPILPKPFILTVRQVKKEKGYGTDKGALKQLGVIKQVINKCDSIIVATDAGREGELIFRYIYEYLKCSKPFERLWISSLTEKAIRTGMENLKPGSDFDGLFYAARTRSRADWLVGINASQALSISGGGNYSLGRVQTPTLALLCKRYLEHSKFISRDYWQLELELSKGFTDFKCLSNDKWDNENPASAALKSIQREGNAVIKAVASKVLTEQPPLLFDLTGLQKEANQKLGFTADETLNLAQGLYEKRFITYPRTGSKNVPEDMWPEVQNLVKALEDRPSCKKAMSSIKLGRLNKRIVNDLKVTDHHGLLITEKIPSALAAKENALYEMIAFRLLEAVSQPCIKDSTTVDIEALHYGFAVRGTIIQEAGWRSVKGDFVRDDEPSILELPSFKIGDVLKIKSLQLLKKSTKPLPLYTEAGLLSAMENAGNTIDSKEERQAILNLGIGTPATRAAIIETLFSRSYISRDKKALVPTQKGLQVYELVKDKKISDVAMTAAWEVALQKIENNETSADTFQKDIETYASSITSELLQAIVAKTQDTKIDCPKCKEKHLIIHDNLVKCPDENCGWVQFRNVCGVTIGLADIEQLVTNGSTQLLKGLKSKSGKNFDAYIVLTEDGKTAFKFENNKSAK